MASPRTNLEAPSMAPKKLLSSSSSRRRVRAWSSSIRPDERSASMAICLPGMASRVKRAETSAMRPALGDDDEIDDHQDAEDDDADDEVAAHDEAAEGLDDLARGVRPLVAVGQDEPRRGEVEGEPHQGGQQQHDRKGSELQRPFDEQRRHQDDHREGDRKGEADVEQPRRHGQDEHDQNADDTERHEDVAAAPHRQQALAELRAGDGLRRRRRGSGGSGGRGGRGGASCGGRRRGRLRERSRPCAFFVLGCRVFAATWPGLRRPGVRPRRAWARRTPSRCTA